MEKGRLPYNAYIRCTDKTIRTSAGGIARAERQGGVHVMDLDGRKLCAGNVCVSYAGEEYIRLCFYRAVNEMRAFGAEPYIVTVNGILPKDLEESTLRQRLMYMDGLCGKEKTVLLPGCIETGTVSDMVMTLSVLGQQKTQRRKPMAGDGLICAGELAKSGMGILLSIEKTYLKERFTSGFLSQAEKRFEDINIAKICRTLKNDNCYIQAVSEGGILAALWDLKSSQRVGFETDLRLMPLAQEAVELSEYLQANPYRIASDGAALITSDDPEKVIRILNAAGIVAREIGSVTEGSAGNIKKDDEISCISRPEPDELYRFLHKVPRPLEILLRRMGSE